MEGQIVKIIRQTHIVNCDNENYACHCRGKIRNKNIEMGQRHPGR